MLLRPTSLDETKHFIRPRVSARRRDDIPEIDADKVDYMDVSPRMMVPCCDCLIPFLENDDCNRALMGSRWMPTTSPSAMHRAAWTTTRWSSLPAPTQAPGINQRPTVEVGESVKAGQVLADGPAMRNGEISPG